MIIFPSFFELYINSNKLSDLGVQKVKDCIHNSGFHSDKIRTTSKIRNESVIFMAKAYEYKMTAETISIINPLAPPYIHLYKHDKEIGTGINNRKKIKKIVKYFKKRNSACSSLGDMVLLIKFCVEIISTEKTVKIEDIK